MKRSAKVVLAAMLAVFASEAWLAAVRPITAAEAMAYDRFVRPPMRETLHQASRNPDVLYALLEKRTVALFHVSEFSIRLPALLAGGWYLWAIWRLCRRSVLVVPLAVAPLAWQCFSIANGLGLALALAAWALEAVPKKLSRAGVYLGLAVASHLPFAITAFILAAIIVWRNFRWDRAVEGFLIPALVTSFIFLVLPLSLAPDTPSVPSDLSSAEVNGVRAAVEVLRRECGTKPIRVGVSAAVAPVLSFYRSRFRLAQWQFSDAAADYYVLPESAAGLAGRGQLIVLHRDGGIVLAR
ncbi:MAG: hypothetical protein ABSF62_04915 [Bryobacteraceae bacterium]|jgi:hypothetical protein